MKFLLSCLVLLILLHRPALAADAQEQGQSPVQENKVSVEDVIPLTAGNMRGHKMLYNEGWYVVTSSSKALSFAKEQSFVSSKTALRQIAVDASKHSSEYKESLASDVKESYQTGKTLVTGGTELSGKILEATHAVAETEYAYAGDRFQKAVESFVRGNLSISRRTEEDRRELAALPGDYFKNVKQDFSNVFDLAETTKKRFSGGIDPAWESAFQKASREFQSEYEKSGTEPNSLMALGPILAGYLKSFYYGIVAPTSKTIVKTTVAGTTYAVFLPVSAVSIVAGRTVQSVGLTVYYAGKTGIKVISPTVEGGLLSGLSLLSLGSVPVTYAAGGALGAVNQVAFTVAGPAAGVVEGTASTGLHSAGYVGFLAYDALKGTTKVTINQAASGLVLGYNALTAVPTHALMGLEDAAVFLAWDGPRLVIAVAKGRIKSGPEPASGESFSLEDLPAGTVVDLKELGKKEGIKVDVLSTDSAVIRNVLEKIPGDVRGQNDTNK
jgi:hypothetical protein